MRHRWRTAGRGVGRARRIIGVVITVLGAGVAGAVVPPEMDVDADAVQQIIGAQGHVRFVRPEQLASGEPLQPEEVLRSSIRYFPKILAAVEKAAAARAKVVGARGAFDSQWETKSLNWLSGFYDGVMFDSKVVKPIFDTGIEVSAGYRLSDGIYPVYQDEFVTNDLGEINFEVVFSLLQDRAFGPRRFALRQAVLDTTLTDIDLLRSQFQVQHAALRSYWDWVAAGQRLLVYVQLLDLALDRDQAFRRRIAEGDLAEIFLIENSQNLLKRQALVVESERDFRVAALMLGLYLRDADGEKTPPTGVRLPAEFPAVTTEVLESLPTDLRRAVDRQVTVAAVETELAKERNRLALGENEMKPQLDLGVKLARDFGGGSDSRFGNDVIVSLDVKYPMRRRKARGMIDEAKANIRSLEQERRLLVDQLDAQVLGIAERIAADVRFAAITSQEVEQAIVLEEAERTRFTEGASDFFVVNVREERTADARVRAIEARRNYFKALADYYAATADTVSLGIDMPLPP